MTTADPWFDEATGPGEAADGAIWRRLADYLAAFKRAFGRAGASGRTEEETRLRIFFVMAMFAAAFLAVSIAATRAALFSNAGPHTAPSLATRAERADLVDRNGEVLATDVPRWDLYVRPAEISDRAGTVAAIHAAAPNVTMSVIQNAVAGLGPGGRAPAVKPVHINPVKALLAFLVGRAPADAANVSAGGSPKMFFVAGGLTPEVKQQLHDLALPGFDFEEDSGRLYPMGVTGAHVIGLARSDGVGVAGSEMAFDRALRVAPGAARTPVALSIDLRVQSALQNELGAAADHFGIKDGVGIVVNVRTGEILAMASWPNYDPNVPGRIIDTAAPLVPINPADPSKGFQSPTTNHAAASIYEPGSVFKVFTLAMGLDSGVAKVTDVFDVHSPIVLPGQTIHDYDKGDKALPLWEVFTHSSNIGAARLGLKAGAAIETRYFRDFGLFAKAPSELLESAHPLLPPRWSENAVATTAFGHSITVSPLMLATGMSAVVNGGLYRPLTLRKLEAGQAPAPGRRVIQPSTSRTMLNLMRLNVTNGTGAGADVPGYRVGGKTGTATKLVNGHYDGGKRNLASFAAVFPADGHLNEDRYLTLIMLDEPKVTAETGGFTTGGAVTAPVAGKVIARIAPLLGLRPVAGGGTVAKADRDKVDASKLTEGGL